MPTASDTDLDASTLALLWAARETGLLAALLYESGGADAAAEDAGVSERAAAIVVDALVAEGFLRRVDDAVEPTNRALGLLATRDLRSVGTTPAALDRFGAFAALPRTMESGVPPVDPEDRLRHRLGAVEALDDDTVAATVDAALAANPDAERALVIADGPGPHARELAARGLDVTLLDGTATAEIVAPLLDGTAVDLRTDSLADMPATFDLVVTVDAAWRASAAENRATVGAAAAAAAPGGAVVFIEPLRDRSAAATRVAAAALATGTGRPYDAAEVHEWFETAGLDDVTTNDVPGTPYQAVIGRRKP